MVLVRSNYLSCPWHQIYGKPWRHQIPRTADAVLQSIFTPIDTRNALSRTLLLSTREVDRKPPHAASVGPGKPRFGASLDEEGRRYYFPPMNSLERRGVCGLMPDPVKGDYETDTYNLDGSNR